MMFILAIIVIVSSVIWGWKKKRNNLVAGRWFGFTVEANCYGELVGISKYFKCFFILRWLWRILLPLLIILCYFGIVTAVAAFGLLLFQDLKSFKLTPSAELYWILGMANIIMVAGIAGLLMFVTYRNCRARRIDMDLLAVLAGFILAIWMGLRILPRGWSG